MTETMDWRLYISLIFSGFSKVCHFTVVFNCFRILAFLKCTVMWWVISGLYFGKDKVAQLVLPALSTHQLPTVTVLNTTFLLEAILFLGSRHSEIFCPKLNHPCRAALNQIMSCSGQCPQWTHQLACAHPPAANVHRLHLHLPHRNWQVISVKCFWLCYQSHW